MRTGKRKRLWALLLSAALIVTQLPAVAMAENATPEDGSIASFEPLDSGVAKQTVDVGTELSELTLPDTVTATIYHVTEDTVIPDEDNMEDESGDSSIASPSDAEESVSGNSTGHSSNQDSGETVTTVTTSTEEISVTWDSEPAYDGDIKGKYVFTADVGGYVLSGSVKLPQITVTVAADTAENPAENPAGEPLPCTKTEGCTLADGHEGECKTKTAVITVTSFDELDSGVKHQSVSLYAPESDIRLPDTLGASGYTVAGDTEPVPEPITITGMTWELTGEKNTPTTYEDGRTSPCSYYFQPVLPEGYTLAGGATLPNIEVRYGWATRANTSDYNTADVEAFQKILTDHPSLVNGNVNKDNPASWETTGLVLWTKTTPKKIYVLSLGSKNLTGTLDVGNMEALTHLDCYRNQLTTLNMGNLTNLTMLDCSNNKLTSLDISGLTSLTSLYCGDNPYESFTTAQGTLTITQTNGGTVTMHYDHSNKQFSLNAAPEIGYQLSKWNGLPAGVTPTGNTADFTLSGDTTVSVEFIADPNDANKNGYHDGDEAAFKAILDAHPSLESSSVDKADPATWEFAGVTWDDSNPKRIVGLDLSGKNLTGTLDVGALTGLASLDCSDNKLAELKGLDKLTALTTLNCGGNPYTSFTTKTGHILTIIQPNNGTITTDYRISDHQLTVTATPDNGYQFEKWTGLPNGANQTGNTATFTLSGDATVAATFSPVVDPDSNQNGYHDGDEEAFKAILDAHFSLISGGVDKDEPATWGSAGVTWEGSNPKRIFELVLPDKNLTGTLDMGDMETLTYLDCSDNQLTALDISGLTGLKALFCENNKLTSLDISGLTSMEALSLSNNPYESFTIAQGTLTITQTNGGTVTMSYNLSSQQFSLNAVPEIGYQLSKWNGLPADATPTGNTADFTLSGDTTVSVEFIDDPNDTDKTGYHDGDEAAFEAILDAHPSLVSGGVDKADPATWGRTGVRWDGSSPKRIVGLDLSDKNLTGTLDVRNLTNLTVLRCDNNQLTTLDVRNLTNLTGISCHTNQLTTLDVGNLTNLTVLSCHTNQLTTLDVGNLTNLTELYCAVNQLTMLDLENLTNLIYLECGKNPYTSFTTKNGHTLTVTPAAGGTVWLGSFDEDNHDVVELTAKPDSGYTFDKWSTLPAGASSTGNTATFNLSSNETVAAVFISTDATLKSLSLSSGTLTPAFHPATTSYTATVGNGVSNVTITAEANNPKANVTGDTGAMTLNVGENTFTVTVTAEDGTPKSYTITITREKAPPAIIPVTGVTLDKSAYTLYTNKDPRSFQLTAKVEPAEASNKAVSWKSSDSNVATVDGNGNVIAVSTGTATITVTTTDGGKTATCTVAVKTYSTGGGGGSSDSNSGGNVTVEPSKPTDQNPNPPTEGVITPPATVDKDGNVKVDVSDTDIQNAIDKAVAQAKKDGTTENGISLSIDLSGLKTTFSQLPLTLSKTAYGKLVDAGVQYLSIRTPQISLSLDLATLRTIHAAAGGDVTIDAVRAENNKLPAELQGRSAYNLTIVSGGETISNFGQGNIAITLPYTLKAGEQGGNLQMAWVDATGKIQYMTGSSYNANLKAMLGQTNHFTVFGIAEKPAPVFTDIENHWAKDDILFAASRNLLNGTGDKVFSPNASMTRGMFVTALGRLAGIDPAAYPSSRFNDVAATAYYAPYVEWAASKGIVSGTTATTFAPEQAVTRQQMAVIMANYAKAMGYTVPKTREAVTFNDSADIASWASEAVKAMQMAGVLNGKDGNRFDPTGTATRAEVAATLHRYVELVIDPATATGWVKNDSGHWIYYKDGKALTGWQTIGKLRYYFNGDGVMHEDWKQDTSTNKWYYWTNAGAATGWKEIGGKWYYFDENGVMAVNTRIDGYEVGPDGARK